MPRSNAVLWIRLAIIAVVAVLAVGALMAGRTAVGLVLLLLVGLRLALVFSMYRRRQALRQRFGGPR